jgi:hypothetical protein
MMESWGSSGNKEVKNIVKAGNEIFFIDYKKQIYKI